MRGDPARLRYLLLDVDNTLYPKGSGVLELIDKRIEAFLRRMFPVSDEELRRIRVHFWERYGTTLGGLIAEHHVDPEVYLAFIHDVPVEELLQPDPALDQLLAAIPAQKVIFTNSSREHALRVAKALGVERHFGEIFDLRDMGLVGKPDPRVYHLLLNRLGAAADECVLIDDSPRNLRTGNLLGMTTIQVGEPPAVGASGRDNVGVEGDFVIEEIGMLGEVMVKLGLLEGLSAISERRQK